MFFNLSNSLRAPKTGVSRPGRGGTVQCARCRRLKQGKRVNAAVIRHLILFRHLASLIVPILEGLVSLVRRQGYLLRTVAQGHFLQGSSRLTLGLNMVSTNNPAAPMRKLERE
jgi:hypothetical protein